MDNQFLHVVRRVEKRLGRNEQADPTAMQDLVSRIANRPWAINYEAAGDLFNSRYWVRNFWKAAYFLAYEYSLTPTTMNRLATQQHLDVVFVGGGSGADVLAFITWFNDSFPLTKLRITVIDGSQKQLDNLALFVSDTADLFSNVELSMQYLHMMSDQWQPKPDSADLLVLSHFLVENPDAVHQVLRKCKDAVRQGGDVVIIERPNDAVIHHARQILANAGLTIYDVITDKNRMQLILDTIADPGQTGITSHYLRATQPDDKIKSDLISSYFAAWRNTVIEPIHDIFDTQVMFQYRPDAPTVDGIKDMLSYWRQKPMQQSNVKVLIRNVSYTGNVAVCAFEGDFDMPTAHEVVKGSLCFNIDTYARKIRRMTGHYGVIKTPL